MRVRSVWVTRKWKTIGSRTSSKELFGRRFGAGSAVGWIDGTAA